MCLSSKLFVLLLFLVFATFLYPQWSSDPATNLAICTVEQTQRETKTCRDNDGNIYIFWRDYRNEPSTFGGDIYAQKLNGNGEAQWAPDGISIVTKSAAQFDAKVLYDGGDGIYVVWREAANLFSDYKIYAQKITLDGVKLWGNYGILLQNISGKALGHSIFVNEDGDLLVSWQLDLTTPNAVDLYAQKINRDGIVQWNSNGLIICNGTARHVYGAQIISDQNGGAIITWNDNRIDASNYDIYAQRISSSGNVLWQQNGIAVSNNLENQSTRHIIPDTTGGALIFWEEFPQQGYTVKVERVDSSGSLWFGGKILYWFNDPLLQYEFIKAKNDEIYFIYTNSDNNIFAQILDYDGYQITGGEIPVCATQSAVSKLAASPGNLNGIVLAWQDNRNGNYDIYAQWINYSYYGQVMWANNGTAICNNADEQTDYSICADISNGAVISWSDMRNGNFDIYAQNIDVRGKLGSLGYKFQRSGMNKIISSLNPTPDSLLVNLPLLKQAAYSSVTVLLDSIIHPNVSELRITLKHQGVIDTIISELYGAENLINCYLDDFAANNLSTSTPTFSGVYKPYKPLTAFLGTDLNGEWILEIESNWSNGILKSWGLIFNNDNFTNVDIDPGANIVIGYELLQNYPNPLNPSTTISWQSPVSGWQTIKLFDILGREIETIVDGYYDAGYHSTLYIVNSKLPSGVYFYQLESGDFIQTKKLILLR